MSDSSSELQREVAAIGEVLGNLESLPGPSRERVLEYVIRALSIGLALPTVKPVVNLSDERPDSKTRTGNSVNTQGSNISDIRSLKEAKNPQTAGEMAAVVAYYLSELAPLTEQNTIVTASDLQRYFKQAGFRLPAKIEMTLVHAASAGYFDRTEAGKYRLNPVGYNLVVHNLPSSSANGESNRRARRRKTQGKKAPAKKAPVKEAPAKKAPVKKVATKKVTGTAPQKTTAKRRNTGEMIADAVRDYGA
jgi:hypothetical protein